MSSYRESLEKYLQTLETKADSCLDIGGSSLPVRDRVKSFDCKTYKIMDNCLEKDTEKEHWQEPDIVWDINEEITDTIETEKGKIYYLKESFDMVFCLEVAEYFYRPNVALNNINFLMKNDAKLIISFPTIYPVHNPMVHDSLRYTEFGIYKLMEEAGFEIEDMIPRRAYHPNLLSDFYKAEGLHPAKRYDHSVLGWVCIATKK